MDGVIEIEFHGLYLKVEWAWEAPDPETGQYVDAYVIEGTYVLDDRGHEYFIDLDDEDLAALEEKIRESEENFAAMDREP